MLNIPAAMWSSDAYGEFKFSDNSVSIEDRYLSGFMFTVDAYTPVYKVSSIKSIVLTWKYFFTNRGSLIISVPGMNNKYLSSDSLWSENNAVRANTIMTPQEMLGYGMEDSWYHECWVNPNFPNYTTTSCTITDSNNEGRVGLYFNTQMVGHFGFSVSFAIDGIDEGLPPCKLDIIV